MGMRIFTVPEAERTLPLVEKIVRDLQRDFQAWRSAVARYEVLTGGARADWGETPDLLEARTEVSSLAERINGYLGELGEIGCIFKGFDGGLVDFYALREDRLVFLCWRLGEPHIRFWHEVDDGFAGRQPLDREMTSGAKP